jgi:hypothetical protein
MSTAERYIQSHERRLDDLEDLVKELIQRSYAAAAGGPPPSGGGGSVRVGRVTGSVSASTGTGPGFGTVQLLKLDGSGNYQDDGSPVSVLNAGAAIASPKRCFVLTDVFGARWATPEEC